MQFDFGLRTFQTSLSPEEITIEKPRFRTPKGEILQVVEWSENPKKPAQVVTYEGSEYDYEVEEIFLL